MIGLVFLCQNFGPLVGTYKCHLLFCECRWLVIVLGGGGDTSILHYVFKVSTFCALVWWEHKTLVYTALTPLMPAFVPLTPALTPHTPFASLPPLCPHTHYALVPLHPSHPLQRVLVQEGVRGARAQGL